MTLDELLDALRNKPDTISFEQVMQIIQENFDFTPTRFANGLGDDMVVNEAGQNEGSCRIFAFAQLYDLTPEQTLSCFGQYYRNDVLQNPDGTDHANIRTFMRHGWEGIQFDRPPLMHKA